MLAAGAARAQLPEVRQGSAVPHEVREMYDRGIQYLAGAQSESGDWMLSGQPGPAVTGLCLLAFLASGDDPNFGPYSLHVRRALRNIIVNQDSSTGCIGPGNMYHHGFAMLALAEAYGTVDDRNLWDGDQIREGRTIGESLELAVGCALASQARNSFGGWRYSPNASDADTSVSGAVFVGLLAARNAGIEVPDQAMDRALAYYRSMTMGDGSVGYSGGPGGISIARSSIAALIYAIARRKDLAEYKATVAHIRDSQPEASGQYQEYTRYYQAQALYQGDPAAWEKWNQRLIRELSASQQPDGSFPGQFGPAYGTAMSLLALAVNYRFLPIYER